MLEIIIIRYSQGLQPVMGDDYIQNYKRMKDNVWVTKYTGKNKYISVEHDILR